MTDTVATTIEPSPTPTEYGIGSISTPDGTKLIVLQFRVASGQTILFFEREAAQQFARAVSKAAMELGGIVVPEVKVEGLPPEMHAAHAEHDIGGEG